MGRPRKEGIEHFPFDTNTHNTYAIKVLRRRFGNDGFAFYIIIVSEIFKSPNTQLILSARETIQILADDVGVDEERFNLIVACALEVGIFDREPWEQDKTLTSELFKRQADYIIRKRENSRKKYDQLA